ncbi:MAG: hypothetical protein CL678_12335 [Bdellovibrionaceae bacterium]|nr:hypothetical protein [Pseudobdellovibrionaceae bacterium]|tara:strand:+ start:2056 stop:2274 length:219 start_codon:yes stop_codon:yes gene_type:complete
MNSKITSSTWKNISLHAALTVAATVVSSASDVSVNATLQSLNQKIKIEKNAEIVAGGIEKSKPCIGKPSLHA